jgi:hypothetical protein
MNKRSLLKRLAGTVVTVIFFCSFSIVSAQESSSNPCVGLEPSDHTLIIGE